MNTKLTIREVEARLKQASFSNVMKPARNKGERGILIENLLGIKSSTDLKDLIDGEVKTYTIGESIAITQLHHCLPEIIPCITMFYSSKLGKKLSSTIYIAFDKSGQYVGYKIFDKRYDFMYDWLYQDYAFIRQYIRDCYWSGKELSTTTGPYNILQIRTKASKNKNGQYTPLWYNGVKLKNKHMAFYLTSKYARSIV